MKSLWRRDDDDTARMVASLITQKDGLWNQLTLAHKEQACLEKRVSDLEIERDEALRQRDEWRRRVDAK